MEDLERGALTSAGAGAEVASVLGLAPESDAAAAASAAEAVDLLVGDGPEVGGQSRAETAQGFATAVSEFSEATKLLKESAEEFKGAKEIIGIANAVADNQTNGSGGSSWFSWFNND